MADKNKVTTRSGKTDGEPSLQSLDAILKIVNTSSQDINKIKSEQLEMTKSIEFCHTEITDIKTLINNQDIKLSDSVKTIEAIKAENGRLKLKVQELELGRQTLEQYSHRNNLIISGIPENNGENLITLMGRLE